MTIEPCPYCKAPPVIVRDTGSNRKSIGCRQVFMRRRPDEAECSEKPAMMEFPYTQTLLVKEWNEWVLSKKND